MGMEESADEIKRVRSGIRAEAMAGMSGWPRVTPFRELAAKVMANEKARQKAVWRGGRSNGWKGQWRDKSGKLRSSKEWRSL